MLLSDIQKHIMDEALKPNDRRKDIIHPSEMAKSDWCHRATYYRMAGWREPEKKLNIVLENVFAEGHGIHAKWQGWLKDMGRLWGNWRCTFCGEVDEGMNFPVFCAKCYDSELLWNDLQYLEVPLHSDSLPIAGHADGAVKDINCLIEIKSIGLGTLRYEAPKLLEKHTKSGLVDMNSLWKDLTRPLPSHVRQANIYLWLCQEMGLSFDRMVFLYENKANQQVKEFVISKSNAVLDPLLDKAEDVKYYLRAGSPPPCEYGGCKECQSWEAANGESEAPGEPGSDVQDGRGQPAGEAGGRQKRSARSESSRSRAAGDARGHNGRGRRRADVADDAADGMGELPGGTVSHGEGRRTVRRRRTKEA